MQKFFQLVASMCFTFAGLSLIAGLINVIFGTHIGIGRGSNKTSLPNDLAGVIAVTDMLLIAGVLAQLAAGPKAAWAYVKSHGALCAIALLVLFVAPAGYVARLALQPPSLRVAIKDGQDPKALDLLLQQGVNVNDADERGITVLMYAMSFSPAEAIDKLLAAGAKTNALDQYGRTALMHCLAYRRRGADDHIRVIKALLSHGADTTIADATGKKTSDYAKESAAAQPAPELASILRF